MADVYAVYEGKFGRAVVLELRSDLVAHSHAESQFAFWLGGSETEAHVGENVIRYGTDVALGTNEYESHDARLLDPSRPAVFLVLYLRKDWLQQLRAETGRTFFFPHPRVVISPPLRQACWRILDIIVSRGYVGAKRLDAEVEALIQAAIDSTLARNAPEGAQRRASLLDARLRAAIGYMRGHVHEPLTAEDIAGRIGLSRTQLFTLFRDQLQTTPQVFWSAVRVEEVVRRLLCDEQTPRLTSLALDLGFSSPGNFSRFFREHMGVSPSTFRRAAHFSFHHTLTGLE